MGGRFPEEGLTYWKGFRQLMQDLEQLYMATNPLLAFIFKASLNKLIEADWLLGTAAPGTVCGSFGQFSLQYFIPEYTLCNYLITNQYMCKGFH